MSIENEFTKVKLYGPGVTSVYVQRKVWLELKSRYNRHTFLTSEIREAELYCEDLFYDEYLPRWRRRWRWQPGVRQLPTRAFTQRGLGKMVARRNG